MSESVRARACAVRVCVRRACVRACVRRVLCGKINYGSWRNMVMFLVVFSEYFLFFFFCRVFGINYA